MSGKPLSPRQRNAGRLPKKSKVYRPRREEDEPGKSGKRPRREES